jgi:hydrogenase maturation protease
MTTQILIACIGNIFLGDDGFGVEAARVLAAEPLGTGVKLIDFGIRGLDLAYALLHPWQYVILVDTIARGGAPGTLYLLQPSEREMASNDTGLDPHSMDPVRVLAMARSLGEVSAEVFIIGCEPFDFGDELEGRMGLSQQVEMAIPGAVEMVHDLLQRWRADGAPIAAD